MKKYDKGKTASLPAKQLQGYTNSLHIHPSTFEKISKAKMSGRCCRIQIAKGEIDHDLRNGGSLWSFLKRSWETVKPIVKPAVSAVLDAAVAPVGVYTGHPELVALGREVIREKLGVGIKASKKKLVKGSPEAKQHMANL